MLCRGWADLAGVFPWKRALLFFRYGDDDSTSLFLSKVKQAGRIPSSARPSVQQLDRQAISEIFIGTFRQKRISSSSLNWSMDSSAFHPFRSLSLLLSSPILWAAALNDNKVSAVPPLSLPWKKVGPRPSVPALSVWHTHTSEALNPPPSLPPLLAWLAKIQYKSFFCLQKKGVGWRRRKEAPSYPPTTLP